MHSRTEIALREVLAIVRRAFETGCTILSGDAERAIGEALERATEGNLADRLAGLKEMAAEAYANEFPIGGGDVAQKLAEFGLITAAEFAGLVRRHEPAAADAILSRLEGTAQLHEAGKIADEIEADKVARELLEDILDALSIEDLSLMVSEKSMAESLIASALLSAEERGTMRERAAWLAEMRLLGPTLARAKAEGTLDALIKANIWPVPKGCISEDEVHTATEEARRIRPEIERKPK